MLKAERQDTIVSLVDQLGTASVAEIAQELHVSEMTVRRDLEDLSQAHRLMRVHGGAFSLHKPTAITLDHEYSNDEKHQRNMEAKRQVAQAAAALVQDGETVFVGTGTTGEELACLLAAKHVRLVTNSLPIFELVKDVPFLDPYLVGGAYRKRTGAFVGPMAERMVSMVGVTRAFIGANGIYDGMVSTANTDEGNLQRLVLGRSAHRYVIADASKVGQRDFFDFYALKDLDALITDASLSPTNRKLLERHAKVIV